VLDTIYSVKRSFHPLLYLLHDRKLLLAFGGIVRVELCTMTIHWRIVRSDIVRNRCECVRLCVHAQILWAQVHHGSPVVHFLAIVGRSSRVIAQNEMEELVKERGGCRRDFFDRGCFALALAVLEFCLRHCCDGNLPKSLLRVPAERADSDCGWLQIMLCYP
jgi:hypothetical protein